MAAPTVNRVVRLATYLAIAALWEAIVRSLGSNSLFPPFSTVVRAFADMLFNGDLLRDAATSLLRVLVGFLCACVLGIGFGILTGRIKLFSNTLGAILQLLRPIPVLALVPFSLLFFGFGENAKVLLIIWGTVFPIWINTHLGVSQVDEELIWAAQCLGASRTQLFFRVLVPGAMRQIVAGMRTALAIAFICLVAAEMVGASHGLGFRIEQSHAIFRVDRMIAATALLAICGASCDWVFAYVVRRVAPWLDVRTKTLWA